MNGIIENFVFLSFRTLHLRNLRKWSHHCYEYIVLFNPWSPFHWPHNKWPWMTLNGHFTLNSVFWSSSSPRFIYLLTRPRFTYLLIRTAPWRYLWTSNGRLCVAVNSSQRKSYEELIDVFGVVWRAEFEHFADMFRLLFQTVAYSGDRAWHFLH